MLSKSLEQLALRCVPGKGPVDLCALATGLVNESYRVERSGRTYSLRVAATHEDLGLDREWEQRVLAAAAAAGLAPLIEYCDPVAGILVADWVSGMTWTAAEIRQPKNIDAVAELLRRVHALRVPQPIRAMNPEAWIAYYRRALARCGAERMSPASTQLLGAAQEHLDDLARLEMRRTPEAVLCHSDVHRHNLAVGARLLLLDWEYAHAADPYLDLAAWIANNDWPESLGAALLAGYLVRPARPAEEERLRLLIWLYDYVCLLWSELYLCRPAGGAVFVSAGRGVAARIDFLVQRLANESGGRTGQLPAH